MRTDGRRHRVPGKILGCGQGGNNYPRVCLYDVDGKSRFLNRHTLVARAWVPGQTPMQRYVHHIDGDRSNPRASNLRWISADEYNRIANSHRKQLKGSDKPTAKLSEEDIIPICETWDLGVTIADIAREYGVTDHTVRLVLLGKTWRHVPREPRSLGTRPEGYVHMPNAKLCGETVMAIRQRYKRGESCGDLAVEYGVDRSTVADAVARRTWRHVK